MTRQCHLANGNFRDSQERPAKPRPCAHHVMLSKHPRAIFGWSDEKKSGHCWRVLVLVRVRPRLDIIHTNAHPCDRPRLFRFEKSARPYRLHPAIHGTAIAELTRVQRALKPSLFSHTSPALTPQRIVLVPPPRTGTFPHLNSPSTLTDFITFVIEIILRASHLAAAANLNHLPVAPVNVTAQSQALSPARSPAGSCIT